MAGEPDPAASRALFTLAAGLEVAVGQQTLQAVERAKQASIVFDEIVVESGLHVVEVSADGLPFTRTLTKERISPELLQNTRLVQEGTTSGLGIRPVAGGVEIYIGTNLPRIEDCFYTQWPVAFRYVSEYHTGLLDDLARYGADWVRVITLSIDIPSNERTIGDDELAVLKPAGESMLEPAVIHLDPDQARELGEMLSEAAEGLNEETPRQEQRSQGADSTVEDYALLDAFKEAVAVAANLGAVPALSSAFERLAAERGVPIQLPGVEGLGFLVPNFSVLPWEEVARFRDHPGSVEARARLREFEAEVARRELPGTANYVRETGRAVSQALLGTAQELAPSLPDDLRSPLLGSAVGLVPIVGQYASLAVSVGDIVAALRQSQSFEGSWIAAIFQLRDAAADTAVNW